ncbi:MAG: phage terminase small subunit [Agitococcus sp.]|nr:phage terminase small subunit [Agitococcus sp.]
MMPTSLKITAWLLSLKISFTPMLEVDMSLARRHFQEKTAESAAKAAGSDTDALKNASAYELQLAQLYEDKRKLKDIQSMETRAEIKRLLLPKYQPYVDGVLAGGKGAQDDVLMTIMLWRLDAHDFEGALVIASYAIHYKLAMPDAFQRTTATLIAEELAINALSMLANPETDKPALLENLIEVELLTRDQDMPDEVRSRLHKALGYCLMDIDPVQALAELKRAFKLHDKSGVKTDIGRLEKQLNKLSEKGDEPPTASTTEPTTELDNNRP